LEDLDVISVVESVGYLTQEEFVRTDRLSLTIASVVTIVV
jgi:hypothetical protein